MINASNAAGREISACSLVIPIFNEEAVFPLLIQRILMVLDTLDASAEAHFWRRIVVPVVNYVVLGRWVFRGV